MKIKCIDPYILFFLICLSFSYCSVKQDSIFNVSSLSIVEQDLLIKRIDSLEKNNIYFKVILKELKEAGNTIYFSINKNGTIAGFQPDPVHGGGKIIFEDLSRLHDDFAFMEEFFHAFQYTYYGRQSMLKDMNGQIVGGPNYEFEARLIKGFIALTYDQVFAETPSQKGLLEFVMGLMDDTGGFTLTELSVEQHEKYINLVEHFQKHWLQRNMDEGMNTLYGHPVNRALGPDACLYVVMRFNEQY